METERYHAGLSVAGSCKESRVIKVLGDYGPSIEASTFKNKRIRSILREYVADTDNIVSVGLEKGDCARRNVMVGQVTHDLRRVRTGLLRR